MFSNNKSDCLQKNDRLLSQETHNDLECNHSRVLDEIAEVTRNNNIINSTETTSFTNLHLANPNNFKIFQNSKHVSNDQTLNQNNSAIKNENDRYVSESSDDDENLFSCQVELTEETETFLNGEIKPINKESITEQSIGLNKIPKIHLKTVDEINRKCIVSNYIDIVKKRRQEVNRRYYLKRKQQMEKQRIAEGEKIIENNIKEKKEEQKDAYGESNEVLVHEKIETKHEQSLTQEQEIEQLLNTDNTNINLEPSGYSNNYFMNEQFPETFVSNFPEIELYGDNFFQDQSITESETYLRDSKKMRKEINRRYYLKRKRKMQLEKGITERIIVKNEAYMRRKERNRRYYLKRKEKMRGTSQEIDCDSSNSQSSSQLNNYCSHFSNESQNNNQTELNSNLDSLMRTDLLNCNYIENEVRNEIKNENKVAAGLTENYTELTQNIFHDQAVVGWVESQRKLNKNIYNYDSDSIILGGIPDYGTSSLDAYLEEATRKRQERNRRYYLKHKEKLKQQRLDKCKKQL